jgi:hypothetical protein
MLHDDEPLRNSDPEYVLFYNDRLDENIGEFHEIYQYINDGDYAEVISRINAMMENNSIDHNLAFTLELAAKMESNPEFEPSAAERDELTDIAWMTTWEGGDGVFNARHILGLEVDDALQFLRLAAENPDESVVALNTETFYQQFRGFENERIEFFDTMGRVVYSGVIGNLKRLDTWQPGLYSFRIRSGNENMLKGTVFIAQ